MVVPPHTTRIGQYFLDPHHALAPEPEPEPEPEPVPDPERRPEPELHSGTSSYHPDWGPMTISRALQPRDIIQILIYSAHCHICTLLLPAHIHHHTLLLLAHIQRRSLLHPARVHQWHLRHSLHPYIWTKRTLIVVVAHNVAWEGAGLGGGGQGHVAGCRGVAPLQQERLVAPLQQERLVAPPGLARPGFDPTEF
ncbi:hypothetical protein PVK06_017453 [Gossypium arboreum]|uniref:Uncharacterized protein n=1 Tax=Gossypium arboreum TaxID=29729 RepID=A0ABR0Q3H5_GOSAR|nr:hypothetical protein PVK06_017453 [Gossypium arboreum]